MIRIREISLPPEHTPAQLGYEAARLLKISPGQIRRLQIVRRSVDARKKPAVRIVYTVDVEAAGSEAKILKAARCSRAGLAPVARYKPPRPRPAPQLPPVVVGFGPAGMFAGLVLALAGQRPLILERGEDAVTRHERVRRFFETGELDERTNVQFGEGGAGTFSDGKLNTGVSNPRISWILEQLVAAGAQEEILFDAKPHVGTDMLLKVVQNIRRRIQELGGQVRFSTQVVDIIRENGRLTGLVTDSGERIRCCGAIFAIGHSARDTFAMLQERNIPMEPKPFAMGVRIEQLQRAVNIAQYGQENAALPPADYKLVQHLEGRTVYTFCMCPGGYVVAAASREGGVVTNGMSCSDRAGENANAALLVSLNPADFPGDDPLAGMRWQEALERGAFQAGGGNYRAPAQLVGDFLKGVPSAGPGRVMPTYRPGVTWTDLHGVLPEVITGALEQAIPLLNQKLPGFGGADCVLTAPETRSSSPVRVLRDDSRQSALRGLYPAGEGAGYAGGIMSAAIDGILSAEALLRNIGGDA